MSRSARLAFLLVTAALLSACGPRGPRVVEEFVLPGGPVPGTAAPEAGTELPVIDYDGPVLEIPKLGIAAPLAPLGLEADGALEVPARADVAGWYTGGPLPGAVGPAVIAGHVDSRDGPGIFAELDALAPGDVVRIRYPQGTVTFAVQGVERHPKDQFPTQRVYSDTESPQLRLVTCGGGFDRRARSYTENVIVYAALANRTGVADGGDGERA